MTETKKTLIFAGVAAGLVILAFLLAPSRVTPDAFLDQGEPFYPDFTDPNTATTLEVISYNQESATASPFKVTFNNGYWTIPSHNDYPADAKDRLARTAAGVIQLTKDDFRTSNVSDHSRCGVIDPLDESAVGLSGRGTRVTIKGEGDRVLADFIVGDSVPERAGFRFVRVPGQNRVYAAKFDVEISTNFADWIDTDLLQVKKPRITRVNFNNYSVNERTSSVVKGEEFSLRRGDDGWRLTPGPGSRELDTTKVKKVLDAIENLRIVGVRPKPEGLSALMAGSASSQSISMGDQVSLQNKGFYLSNQGGLLANEGEAVIRTDQGIVYRLRFGEVLYGSGLEVSAGVESDDDSKGSVGEKENRYLLVTAEFDPSVFGSQPPVPDTSYMGKPDSLLTEVDKSNREKYQELSRWRSDVEAGRATAETLNSRFANWYYVISGEDFSKVHISRSDLFKTDES